MIITALWNKSLVRGIRVVLSLDNSVNLHPLTRDLGEHSVSRTAESFNAVKAYGRSASKQLQLAMDQPRLDEDTFCRPIRILTASAQGGEV